MNKKEHDEMQMLKDILGLVVSLSTVFGIFTGIINRSFAKRIKPLENKIDANEKENIKHSMGQLRYLIVGFANDLRNGIPKNRFQYDAVFSFIDEYNDMITKLNIKNGLFHEEENFIREEYRKLIKDK